MKDLRIVFMGTPDFAVESLRKLANSRHSVVGVITAPDKPAGRGRRLRASAVKNYAREKGLKILQPKNLKSEDFIRELKALEADLQIVVAFRMLPRVVWEMPRFGTINLHASLLPEYRGAAPINWAIINGEEKTGITTFYINEKIDTGDIIMQEEEPIEPDDTAGDLHDRLMHKGAELVLKTVQKVASGEVESKEQQLKGEFRKAPKIYPETCRIEWDRSGKEIYDLVRGLSPYPGAWAKLIDGEEETQIKVYAATWEKSDQVDDKQGAIHLRKDSISVVVKDGYILITELQLAGRKRMPAKNAIAGLRLSKNAHMG